LDNALEYKIAWALQLARMEFNIFPLAPGEKTPVPEMGDSWYEYMSRDEDQIRAWFKENPDYNYAVNPSEGYGVIDLDIKDGKAGDFEFEMLEAENCRPGEELYNKTFTVYSWSGGRHLYCNTSFAISNRHSRFNRPGIDVRGVGGYVVGPGSCVNGKYYEVQDEADNRQILDAPGWVMSRFTPEGTRDIYSHIPIVDLDTEPNIRRAKFFLTQKEPAVAHSEEGGNNYTYQIAQGIFDCGVSIDTAVDILTLPTDEEGLSWNDRCDPPWDLNDLRRTIENAWKYRRSPVGIRGGTPEEIFGIETKTTAEGEVFVVDSSIQDISTINLDFEKDTLSIRQEHIKSLMLTGSRILDDMADPEWIVPEWILAHGIHAILAKRGVGKTVFMMDMALCIATDKPWMNMPVEEGCWAIYLCGEDEPGAKAQFKAWIDKHNGGEIPERFIMAPIVPDLMSDEDFTAWINVFKNELIPDGARAVVFLDTWQRATSSGGANKDEDVQKCVHNAEALATVLNGPVIIANHPPKGNSEVVLGHSYYENSTVCIILITDKGRGKEARVIRLKGKGENNYVLWEFESVEIGINEKTGRPQTGIVTKQFGGTDYVQTPEEVMAANKITTGWTRICIESLDLYKDVCNKSNPTVLALSKFISGFVPSLTDKGIPVDGIQVLIEQTEDKITKQKGQHILDLFDDYNIQFNAHGSVGNSITFESQKAQPYMGNRLVYTKGLGSKGATLKVEPISDSHSMEGAEISLDT